MKIKDLFSVLPQYQGYKNPGPADLQEIKNLRTDHRLVEAGDVFVALKGSKFDAHTVLGEVCAKGAIALVVEDKSKIPKDFSGVYVQMSNNEETREALSEMASFWNAHPSKQLLCFGVTGTNGKTSCTFMMEHLLNVTRLNCGVIGTINQRLLDKNWETENTTPGAMELQARLREMVDLGAKTLAMEVSSHALDQQRVDSIHFNVVMFTNLSRDHLDYHQSMEQYFAAKQRLFTDLMWKTDKVPAFAVINIDDNYGKRIRIPSHIGLWTYGQHSKCDWHFKVKEMTFSHTAFDVETPFGVYHGLLPLCGVHNVYNAVGVLASAAAMGLPPEYALQQLKNFKGVPGRLQFVTNERQINLFVDYAHSPDALENVLKSILEIRKIKNRGRIITVFGCGGDRDKGKRPEMAKIAERYSNIVIVTSDNPRSEDPMQIINEIGTGFTKLKPEIIEDRRSAIGRAIQLCEPEDVVLIAGKGHENYQIVGSEKMPFSDFDVATEILNGVSRKV